MSATAKNSFLQFLEAGIARGGFETDDTLAVILPLMRQVAAAHEEGLVAPLNGVEQLRIDERGHLSFDPAGAMSPQRDRARVERMQGDPERAIEVTGHSSRTADVDRGAIEFANLEVATSGSNIDRPA
jgi:hypothetical protein